MRHEELASTTEAVGLAGVPRNFLLNGKEIPIIAEGRRKFFSKKDIESWKKFREERTYLLTIDDYAKCFDFALAMYYRRYTQVDWSSARRREAGQSITNWIKGQLGEIVVQRFFKEKFRTDIELDFGLHGEIVPQDITGVKDGAKIRPPKLKVAVKSTKMNNCFLILSPSEVELANRKSDLYVLARIGLPDDHLIQISKEVLEKMLKNQQHFSSYMHEMKGFEPIRGEVVGFCEIGDLEKEDRKERLKAILGTANPTGYRYIKASGDLKKSEADWKEIIRSL